MSYYIIVYHKGLRNCTHWPSLGHSKKSKMRRKVSRWIMMSTECFYENCIPSIFALVKLNKKDRNVIFLSIIHLIWQIFTFCIIAFSISPWRMILDARDQIAIFTEVDLVITPCQHRPYLNTKRKNEHDKFANKILSRVEISVCNKKRK